MGDTAESRPVGGTTQAEVLLRLRRIEGQVRGIQRMVEENRDCRDVVPEEATLLAGCERDAQVDQLRRKRRERRPGSRLFLDSCRRGSHECSGG